MATRIGGMALLSGMTVVTAVSVALFSRMLPRWRFLFPPEVVGLIAFMVGASQASLAVQRFLGMEKFDQIPGLAHINPSKEGSVFWPANPCGYTWRTRPPS